ncbi:MAG: hypothetical protein K8L99_35505, partial [Anaerolineae bacterium]|nr:hypothetical protein [Anaerolineae bacterium]
VEVAGHAVNWLAEHEGWQTDIVVIRQPTSPLRTAQHIDEALSVMLDQQADTVVSVMALPHHASPFKIMKLEGDRLKPFWDQPLPFDPHNRHSVPVLYARNGPAVLATRTPILLESGTFYGDHIAAYVMSEEESFDIDTPLDLKIVEWLLRERQGVLNQH